MTKTLQAWVLHKQWSGDTSARVSFYTQELGLVTCLYKGGRTPKKQALLQAFNPLWVSFDERRERYYVSAVESNQPPLGLQGDSLFSGLYVNELLYYVLSPLYPDANLYSAYLQTLNALVATTEPIALEALLRRFEWTLLTASGASFSLLKDARTEEDIQPEWHYQFVIGEGIVRTKQGIPGEHILALAADELHEAHYLKSAKYIMRQAIDDLVGGREIKARALYAASKM
ncbi:MAG: DNA repair protein RecO [Legionella sp.]|nr:MAG: DNA repair protein RecO [Legionella sp.]